MEDYGELVSFGGSLKWTFVELEFLAVQLWLSFERKPVSMNVILSIFAVLT